MNDFSGKSAAQKRRGHEERARETDTTANLEVCAWLGGDGGLPLATESFSPPTHTKGALQVHVALSAPWPPRHSAAQGVY